MYFKLLLPLLCGIFFCESVSVMIQRSYFKATKKKYGTGRRIFTNTPLHHHFQKGGNPSIFIKDISKKKVVNDPKLVTHFWIVQLILAVLTLALLKIR